MNARILSSFFVLSFLLALPASVTLAQVPIGPTIETTLSDLQDQVQDAVDELDGTDLEQVQADQTVRVTIRPGQDADGDGRTDYLWFRQYTKTGTNVQTERASCFPIQTDFVWDGETATGSGTEIDLQEEDGSVTDDPNVRATLMLYNGTDQARNLRQGPGPVARGCPIDPNNFQDPDFTPRVERLFTGHIEVVNNGAQASEGTPTRILFYDDQDIQNSIDLFVRDPAGPDDPPAINVGPHVVLRSFTVGQVDARTPAAQGLPAFGVFPLPIDFTNIHLVSGNSQAGLVTRHDLDDDGSTDAQEATSGSNPLNNQSFPNDWDGDGVTNAQDAYPTDPERFRDIEHTVTITSPASGDLLDGTATITWDVASTGNTHPIAYFDVWLHRDHTGIPQLHWKIGNKIPATARSFTWDLMDNKTQLTESVVNGRNFRIRVNVTDDGGLEGTNQTALLRIQVARAATATINSVVDANGFLDRNPHRSGALDITATWTPGRTIGGTSQDDKRTFVVTLSECSAGAIRLTRTLENQTSPFTLSLSKGDVDAAMGPGLEDCGQQIAAGTAIARLVITERQNDYIRTTAASSTFSWYKNRQPELSNPLAAQTDPGDNTAETSLNGTKARFRITYKDLDGGCGSGGPASVKVHVRVLSTGLAIAGSPFSMTPAPAQTCGTGGMNNFPVGVTYQALVGPLTTEQTYAYFFETLDADSNRNDDRLVNVPGPAVRHPLLNDLTYTHGHDAVGGVTKTITDEFNEQFGCEAGETQAACLQRFVNEKIEDAVKKADDAVKSVEDSEECDVPELGYDDKYEKPCSDKPAEIAQALAELVQDEAEKLVEQVLDAVNNATGIPNPYPLVCDLEGGCDIEDDADSDRFTDQEESGESDPFNPYSTPSDKDADLVFESLETYVDVHLYRIAWMNTTEDEPANWHECGEADRQDDCAGQLVQVPSGERSVGVYLATGATKDSRIGAILAVRALSDDVLEIRSDIGCGVMGGQAAQLQCGFTWTVLGGLLEGPSFENCNFAANPPDVSGCKIHLRVNAEDDDRLVEVTVDMAAISTEGQPVLAVQFLGGRRTTQVQQGSTVVQVSHEVAAVLSPANLIIDGENHWDAIYNLNNSIQSGTAAAGKPSECSATAPQPSSGTGNWLRTDRTEDNRWRICGQVGTGGPNTFWHETPAHFVPIVGTFADPGGAPTVWLDRDGDQSYDLGEELTPTCEEGEDAGACVTRKVVENLGCPGTDTLAECLSRTAGEAAGCDEGEVLDACAERQLAEALGCNEGESLDACLTRQAVIALGCDEGNSLSECLNLTAGCEASDTADQCADREAKEAIAPVPGPPCTAGETAAACLQRKLVAIGGDPDGDGSPTTQELAGTDHTKWSNPFYKYSTPEDPAKPGDENGMGFLVDWDGDSEPTSTELLQNPQSNPFQRCSKRSDPNGDGQPGGTWNPTAVPPQSCEP